MRVFYFIFVLFLFSGCSHSAKKELGFPNISMLISKCEKAGYNSKQMIELNYDCMNLEELKPYMSSNTYENIKMGEPAEKYKFLKKITKNTYEYDKAISKTPLDHIGGIKSDGTYNNQVEFVGDIYTTDDKKIIVATRYGLVDTIIVKLGVIDDSSIIKYINIKGKNIYQIQNKVVRELKNKYTLFDAGILNNGLYLGFNIGHGDNWHFKNGEDNIIYLLNKSYQSTIIYTSNINQIIEEMIKEKKHQQPKFNKKQQINSLNKL